MDLPTILISIISALGGGAIVAAAIFSFGARIFESWFNKRIDSAQNKILASYSDEVSRKTLAYKFLLEKEMNYYNDIQIMTGKLITAISSINTLLQKETFSEKETNDALNAIETINNLRDYYDNSNVVYKIYANNEVNKKVDHVAIALREYTAEAFSTAKIRHLDQVPYADSIEKLLRASQKCINNLGALMATISSVVNDLSGKSVPQKN